MSPRITVAIAFHNEERHLASAVRSILAQTESDFELHLLDDGSTDKSAEIAREFLADPRVRLSADGERRHLAARLNEALLAANGHYFARMDADDVCHPARLAKQSVWLDARLHLEAVGAWAAVVTEKDIPYGVIESTPQTSSGLQIVERGLIPHATMLARTNWLRSHGYDESLARAEDRDLWCRVGLERVVDVVPEVLYTIRVVTNSRSFLADYLRGQADFRCVVRRYGRRLAGRAATLRILLASHAKASAMAIAHAAGASKLIVYRRGRPLTESEHGRVAECLASGHSP